MSDQVTLLVLFAGNHCGVLHCLYSTEEGSSAMLQQYIGLYTRLTCVHVEPAHQTLSTAPPLPCETRPAQRLSITLVGDQSIVSGASEGIDLETVVFCRNWEFYKSLEVCEGGQGLRRRTTTLHRGAWV